MSTNLRRNAFTLIDVLVVVVIMAVLAAMIMPQFTSSTLDVRGSSLRFNLQTIRAQIELYKVQHTDKLPAMAEFVTQMTGKTDIDGAQTGTLLYGPYIQDDIPVNPYNDSNEVVAVAAEGAEPAAVVAGGAGWQYDQSTGGFYPNNSEWYE